jgi:hypothetical protein
MGCSIVVATVTQGAVGEVSRAGFILTWSRAPVTAQSLTQLEMS